MEPLLFDANHIQPAWFALYVQVNHEKEVAQRLLHKPVESYLPLLEQWSKRRDRRKKIQVPLFPGYIFVRAVMDNQAHVNIVKTPGAVWILRNSEGPLSIPDFQIESLKVMLRTTQAVPASHPYLEEGDWVHVIRGPLEGCTGILIRQNPGKGKLVVSMDIIQKSVSVQLDIEDIEPIPKPASNLHLSNQGKCA